MRRLALYLLAASLIPLAAAAQGLPSGSIIPDLDEGDQNLRTCAAGWKAVLIISGGFLELAIYIAMLIAVLVIVYAGIIFLFNATNPENLSKGKKILGNAAIGLLITLCAWLLVNTVLTSLGAGDIASRTSVIGSGGSLCITIQPPQSQIPTSQEVAAGLPLAPPPRGTGSCDPIAVRAAAAAGGYQISEREANTFACLAGPESSCGANVDGATTPSGQRTSAAGPWQNILGFKDKCHSLNIPACGNLQCHQAFSGGVEKSDPASRALAAKCRQALANLTCAAAAAVCLNNASGNDFSDWTADSRSSKQKKCIRDHAGL
ncbi:MAG: hypothetical protein KBC38_00240 [Candidatus Pacebacteria bacterium]|nr:hypothetical protein [Candidatus Paceibacterota bacterium]MBP9840427.1 hypothetical protein [Candidatus Paceibacterota bacterium]